MCAAQWLQLKDTDDEKTKARKRKLQKSHKSKLRFQQLDQEVKQRQDNWQSFKKGKGAKKKARAAACPSQLRGPSHLSH